MTEEQQIQQTASAGSLLSKLSWLSIGCGPLLAVGGFLLMFMLIGAFIGLSGSSGNTNSGQTQDAGNLGYMPAVLRPIFTKAAGKYDISVHLLAAIFSAGEHDGSFPTHGPWAYSSVGASGPFQFMPATWTGGYADDCNGDGVKDIQSLDDASCGAAHLLANDGAKGMYDSSQRSESNIKRAIYGYNHAQFYVDDVWKAYIKFLNYQP